MYVREMSLWLLLSQLFYLLFKSWFVLLFAAAEQTHFLKENQVWFTKQVFLLKKWKGLKRFRYLSFDLKLSTKWNVTDIAMTRGMF